MKQGSHTLLLPTLDVKPESASGAQQATSSRWSPNTLSSNTTGSASQTLTSINLLGLGGKRCSTCARARVCVRLRICVPTFREGHAVETLHLGLSRRRKTCISDMTGIYHAHPSNANQHMYEPNVPFTLIIFRLSKGTRQYRSA